MTVNLCSTRHGCRSLENLRFGNSPAFESRSFKPNLDFLPDGTERFFIGRAVREASRQFGNRRDERPVGVAPANLHAIAQC